MKIDDEIRVSERANNESQIQFQIVMGLITELLNQNEALRSENREIKKRLDVVESDLSDHDYAHAGCGDAISNIKWRTE